MKPVISNLRLICTTTIIVIIVITGFHASALQRITTTPTSFRIEVLIPAGYRFNSKAPSLLTVGNPETTTEQIEIKDTSLDITISIPATPQFSINGEARVFFCDDTTEPQCFMKQVSFKKEFTPDTSRKIQIAVPNPRENTEHGIT